MIAENASGIPSSTGSTQNPLFHDPVGGDLRAPPSSPAVNFCDAIVYSPIYSDIDGESRGYDYVANINGAPGIAGGTYDVGFDEALDIFSDGFESGDTSGWNSVVP